MQGTASGSSLSDILRPDKLYLQYSCRVGELGFATKHQETWVHE
jgi:hypothetical protein